MPERLSLALRVTSTSLFCQPAGAAAAVVGAWRSILIPLTAAAVVLPARSLIDASAARSSPSPLMVLSAGQGPARPDSASAQVQLTVTSPLYQPAALGAAVTTPLKVGSVRSTLMLFRVAPALFPAASVALPLALWPAP